MDGNSKHTILVIDNDPDNVKFITESLELFGDESAVVSCEEEALEYISNYKADLIIINSVIRNLDIYRFITSLSVMPNAAGIPLLILLTKKDEFIDKLIIVPPVQIDYLIMPFSIIDMYVRIRNLLNSKASLENNNDDNSYNYSENDNDNSHLGDVENYDLEIASNALNAMDELYRKMHGTEEFASDNDKSIMDFTSVVDRSKLTKKLNSILSVKPQKSTLLIADVDNSRVIAKTYGIKYLAKTVKTLKERLNKLLPGYTIIKTGFDEFSIIIENNIEEKYIKLISENILNAIEEPIWVEYTEISVKASIGIAFCPSDSNKADMLVQHAETALHHAKQTGKNKFTFYRDISAEMGMTMTSPLLINSIRNAIADNEFMIYYQPFYRLQDMKIAGFEALLRWSTDTFRNASPWNLIRYAEENGLIWEIDQFVLNKICEFSDRINKGSNNDIFVSMNVSPYELRQESFADDMLSVIKRKGINPALIGIEFSENYLNDATEDTDFMFRKLKNYGIRISVDDYGTGPVSVKDLMTAPVDIIKLDKTVTGNITDNDRQFRLIKAIIYMAGALDIQTLAEGVETHEQLELLIKAGCEYGEGYYLGKPQPEREAVKFLNL